MLRRCGMERQRLLRPGTESIDDGIEAREIFLREVEDVFLAVILCLRVIFRMAAKGDNLMAAIQGLGDDFLSDRPFAATTAIFIITFSFSRSGLCPVSFATINVTLFITSYILYNITYGYDCQQFYYIQVQKEHAAISRKCARALVIRLPVSSSKSQWPLKWQKPAGWQGP